MAEGLYDKNAASDEYRKAFQGSEISDSLSMACDYYYDPFCEVCAETKNQTLNMRYFAVNASSFYVIIVLRFTENTWEHDVTRYGEVMTCRSQWLTNHPSLTTVMFTDTVGKTGFVFRTEYFSAVSVYIYTKVVT